MTPSNPNQGGSYVVDDKGGLKRREWTEPSAPYSEGPEPGPHPLGHPAASASPPNSGGPELGAAKADRARRGKGAE